MMELTVPWGKDMEAAFKRKKDKYSELTAECREAGRSTLPYPVEVGCQGFPGTSPLPLLSDWHKVKEGQGFLLWLRRKDKK